MTADDARRRPARSGSSRGARISTAPRRCGRSSSSRARSPNSWGRTYPAGRARVEAGAHRLGGDPPCLPRCQRDDRCVGVIAWMHTFSPAKMWIHGLDELRKPLLHLHTQANESLPWSTIDMDFMNLNQAAHGDREFAHVVTRLGVPRKTVAGHVGDPAVRRRVGDVGAGERRGAGVAQPADGPLRRQHAQRRRHRRRQGRGRAPLRRVGQHVRRQRPRRCRRRGERQRGRRRSSRPASTATSRARTAARRRARRVAALRRAHRGGTAPLPRRRRVRGVHDQLRGSRRPASAARAGRAAADGRRLSGSAARATGRRPRSCTRSRRCPPISPGGTSFMEDYTYHFGPGEPKVLGAHMLEVCPSITTEVPRVEIHPLSIGAREDPVRLVFTADAGPGIVVGLADLGDRFRLVLNSIDLVAPDEPMPKLPVGHAVWQPRPDMPTAARVVAAQRRAAPHDAVDRRRHRGDDRPRRDAAHRARRHRRAHDRHARSPTSCAGARPTTASPRASEPHLQSNRRRRRANRPESVASRARRRRFRSEPRGVRPRSARSRGRLGFIRHVASSPSSGAARPSSASAFVSHEAAAERSLGLDGSNAGAVVFTVPRDRSPSATGWHRGPHHGLARPAPTCSRSTAFRVPRRLDARRLMLSTGPATRARRRVAVLEARSGSLYAGLRPHERVDRREPVATLASPQHLDAAQPMSRLGRPGVVAASLGSALRAGRGARRASTPAPGRRSARTRRRARRGGPPTAVSRSARPTPARLAGASARARRRGGPGDRRRRRPR